MARSAMLKAIPMRAATAAVASFNRVARGDEVVVCCAPVPEGNRGDQALLAAVTQTLQQAGHRRIHLVQTSNHPILSIKSDEVFEIHEEFYAVFSTPLSFREQLAFVRFLKGKRHVILIGADVLDEGYSVARSEGSLFAMHLAARAGCEARIIGFSINGVTSEGMRNRFLRAQKSGVRMMTRDAVSLERLVNAGITSAELVGDLAFLMQPAAFESLDEPLRRFIRRDAGPLVGLNFTEVVMGSGPEKDRFVSNLVEACGRLAREDGCRFLCIPHDEQGGMEYLTEIQGRIAAAHPGVSYMISPLPTAPQLKRIAGECLHVFTCRLHLGIATLGMGRPVTGFPYQGKFEGQFNHFGLSDGLIPKDQIPPTAEGLTELLRQRIRASDQIAARVQERLPGVLELSMKNFEGCLSAAPTIPGIRS
jgi:polysaccharide pyruvyl transferase WcaK-like protein